MDPVIDVRTEIEDLVAFDGRGPGTDAERRGGGRPPPRARGGAERGAAEHLRRRLEALGRDVDVEPTWIRPNWPLALTMYAVLGVTASIVATAVPLAGAIAAGLVLVATVLDIGGRIRVARLAMTRGGSANGLLRG